MAKNGVEGVGNGHGNNGKKSVVNGQTTGQNGEKRDVVRRRATDSGDDAAGRRSRFSIVLSARFLLLSFCISVVLAFAVGWAARLALLSQLYPRARRHRHRGSTIGNDDDNNDDGPSRLLLPSPPTSSGGMSKKGGQQLPAPKVIEGKDVPFTTYASKTFQMAGAATSHTLHIDRTGSLIMSRSRKEFDGGPDFQKASVSDVGGNDDDDGPDGDGRDDGWVPCESNACSRGKEKKGATTSSSSPSSDDDHNDDSDGLHLPAGQHLLVDIKDVDSNFLNSEERLAMAMIELINESRLTLLSYHCHSLVPIGVSCAGVLLESHVAFHTWPAEGVITMDLFTCGGGLLIPTLPSIERLFGVPSSSVVDPVRPTMLWSHKLRGFREGFAPGYVRSMNPLDGSLGRYVLGKLDFDVKRPMLSTRTAHQSVNIYEVADPKMRGVSMYRRSLMSGSDGEDGSSYESTHPENFGPDKILFLDGIIQSTLYGDAPYHESIVHPAMLVHPGPRRVAIIGGGEGATLREVLKHKGVEEVIILEIDKELVEICAEHMPEWSYCGDIDRGGSDVTTSCFDDPRARVMYADAFDWFVDRFGNDAAANREDDGEKFDVIIMDSLDPKTSLEIAGGLYDSTSFVDSLFNGLTEKGVFVVQMGKSRMITDPPDEVGRFKNTGLMIKALEQSGFESIHTYDEGHSHFHMPWSYLVALKDYKSKAGWHRNAPEFQIALQQRLHRTKSGQPILRYFDAATMVSYQIPSRAQETTYCRQEVEDETRWDCDDILDLYSGDIILLPLDTLRVGKSGVGERAGRGLFATRDIPSRASIGVEKGIKGFMFPPSTWSIINSFVEWPEEKSNEFPFVEDEIAQLYTYAEGYGTGAIGMGEVHFVVESSILLFMNHGCNGTFNYGDEDNKPLNEMSGESLFTKDLGMEYVSKTPPFSPVIERHLGQQAMYGDVTLRDIKRGEEVLTDYLAFGGDIDGLLEDARNLRGWCTGKSVGEITNYEEG